MGQVQKSTNQYSSRPLCACTLMPSTVLWINTRLSRMHVIQNVALYIHVKHGAICHRFDFRYSVQILYITHKKNSNDICLERTFCVEKCFRCIRVGWLGSYLFEFAYSIPVYMPFNTEKTKIHLKFSYIVCLFQIIKGLRGKLVTVQ